MELPKTTRRSNEMCVMERIYRVKGGPFIEEHYENAYQNSKPRPALTVREFASRIWLGLYRNRIVLNEEYDVDRIDDLLEFYNAFMGSTSSLGVADCAIHTGAFQAEYPIVAVRLREEDLVAAGVTLKPNTNSDSFKIQLHQVPFYNKNDWDFSGITHAKSCFAHSCHEPRCLVHATHCDKGANVSQSHCPCFTIVGRKLLHTCTHHPQRCIYPGNLAFAYQEADVVLSDIEDILDPENDWDYFTYV